MLQSIITFVFRSFKRNISFSLIALSSLVLGITSALLIFVWINYEFSYNKSITDNDRVFALLINDEIDGEINTDAGTSAPIIDFLTQEVPEVEAVSRTDNHRTLFTIGDQSIQKQGVYADSSFFKVYTPSHLSGNADKVLVNNRNIAISETLAIDLFGTDNVLGKTIIADHKDEFIITGVYTPYPANSSCAYIDYVMPISARGPNADDWLGHDIKLFNASSREAVEKKLNQKFAQLYPLDQTTTLLFPLKDWRLYWHFVNGKASGGRIVYVTIFGIASLFVLIMSCVNYTNMATARATKRAREIGVRKMTGATQFALIKQFISEALIMTSGAAILSIILTILLLPMLSLVTGVHLILDFGDSTLWIAITSIVLVTTFMAGGYPAFVLSSFRPAVVLKGNLYSNISGQGLRKSLVAFQFTLSVVMIFCALVISQQIEFLLQKDLGFDKHRVINVWLDERESTSLDDFHALVTSHTSIESAAFGGASPIEINGAADCNKVVSPFSTPLLFYGANIDEHTLPTLKFELVAGRNFSRDFASDSSNFIINETAANLLGFENPIGQRISYNMFGPQEGEIVGVIKDFQNDDIHVPVKPVVLVIEKSNYIRNLFVRYKEGKREEALAHLKEVFGKYYPNLPMDFSYLDADFELQLYQEKLLKEISFAFTLIAICIACLGLFGLVIFNTQRRTKEIGIRKVLGASVRQVVLMLFHEFIPPVIYSLLVAFPIGYYLMQRFLNDYPSRIHLTTETYLSVGSLVMLMALCTVAYQSIKAANRNTVDSLKVE